MQDPLPQHCCKPTTSSPPKRKENTESEPQHNAQGLAASTIGLHLTRARGPCLARHRTPTRSQGRRLGGWQRCPLPEPQTNSWVTASCQHHLVALPSRTATATKPEDQGRSLAPSNDDVQHQRTQRHWAPRNPLQAKSPLVVTTASVVHYL
jgi:hypothetical protein